jgi:hypothetical protein
MQTCWQRACVIVACAALALVSACGGSSKHNPDPRLIAGGGAGDGAIKGVLHVYVIDGLTSAPIVGATVQVENAGSPLTATTDATGLATIEEGKLKGAQTVTATATSYAAATWVGADAANLTIPLEPNQAPTVKTAKASGTISGWDTRPDPGNGHLLIAYVGYSYIQPFDAPENSIAQDTQTVAGLSLPTNICYSLTLSNQNHKDCNFQLKTRLGKQALWAVVVDIDTKGTLDRADDTYQIVDYAFLLGQEAAEGHTYTSLTLTPVGANALTQATVAFQAAPSGMTAVAGLPIVELGEQGMIVMSFAPFGPNNLDQKVPMLTGALASYKYDFLAEAKASATDDYPQATIWKHEQTLGGTVDYGAWPAVPAALSATGGTYSFTGAASASLHTVKLVQSGTSGTTVAWNIALLDGSTSFTLPTLAQSPLPSGTLQMRAEALALTTFAADDFSVTSLRDDALWHSADQIDFTR